MDGPPRLVVEDSPDPADLALLEDRVAEAAIAAAGVGDDHEFAVFVRDDEARVVAGLSATVWGRYCELQALWVHESLRGRGLARALFAEAEAEAQRRGCTQVVFHAYDLLAPALYERFGYETVAVIEDCPTGSSARWYHKELPGPVRDAKSRGPSGDSAARPGRSEPGRRP
jgi:ribosomal protein S18 acetylase RimI-like enzyme